MSRHFTYTEGFIGTREVLRPDVEVIGGGRCGGNGLSANDCGSAGGFACLTGGG